MKEIKLNHKQVAIVDDEDFELLNQFKWYACKSRGHYYAERGNKVRNGIREKPGLIRMHRQVVNCPIGMQVDHINHNTLDNRKENLRICTIRQNLCNRKTKANRDSKYKGVDYNGISWCARIGVHRNKIYLGSFKTEEQAAVAYDQAAIKHFGEFANLNFKRS
jgi:hypothetical protein